MELRVLGCWSPYPRAGGSCSGYLISEGETHILVDFGSGCFSRLQRYFDFRRLQAVVISHLHPDHFLDVFTLRYALRASLWNGSRQEKLPLYLPGEPAVEIERLVQYREEFDLHIMEECSGLAINIGDLRLQLCKTEHPVTTFAVRIEGASTLVYSADTAWDPDIIKLAEGADLFLCEASVLEKDKEYVSKAGHLTAHQAGTIAREAGVKRLVITHFFPEYDLKTLRLEAEEGFNGPVELAQEGLRYIF
ncbi:MBL fold metallo-hydrolase [Calderihabitans maritimus]|uniref:Beta-lactamase domain-containing protein n=1 Tax=Calderihabitans maritimus TaxID=1246530 RepID=A0A1Z5HPP8_9FIRM|nr:MBL fold metallo-hydrolase [Calderihabitans maritimus]GAW91275.1 beta-lactamase domain-containing protein [Calderihabitans maritimus]